MAVVGIAERLSNAGWPSALPPPDELTFIARGFGTNVYGVPGAVVVRVARTNEAAQGMVREAALLRALSGRLPVEVPYPVWSASPGGDLPHGALALSWVGGTTPAGPAEAPKVPDLVGFLVALHRQPISVVEPISLPDDAALIARRRADAAIARDIVRKRWSARDVDAFEHWLERTLAALDQTEPAVLIHGDYWYGNLRVSDGVLHGVLDWEEAALSDRAADLGPILYLGGDVFDEAVREYASALRLDHRGLAARARANCEARELSGVRACVSANDHAELESELLKLRRHL